jgi:hypothetical protein
MHVDPPLHLFTGTRPPSRHLARPASPGEFPGRHQVLTGPPSFSWGWWDLSRRPCPVQPQLRSPRARASWMMRRAIRIASDQGTMATPLAGPPSTVTWTPSSSECASAWGEPSSGVATSPLTATDCLRLVLAPAHSGDSTTTRPLPPTGRTGHATPYHCPRSLLGGACMALSPNACRGRARPELTGPSCYPVLAWANYTARKSLVRSKERTPWL